MGIKTIFAMAAGASTKRYCRGPGGRQGTVSGRGTRAQQSGFRLAILRPPRLGMRSPAT